MLKIAQAIAFEFRCPVRDIRPWDVRKDTAVVLMPETAVDKDDLPSARVANTASYHVAKKSTFARRRNRRPVKVEFFKFVTMLFQRERYHWRLVPASWRNQPVGRSGSRQRSVEQDAITLSPQTRFSHTDGRRFAVSLLSCATRWPVIQMALWSVPGLRISESWLSVFRTHLCPRESERLAGSTKPSPRLTRTKLTWPPEPYGGQAHVSPHHVD